MLTRNFQSYIFFFGDKKYCYFGPHFSVRYFGLDATNFTLCHDKILKADNQKTEKQGILC